MTLFAENAKDNKCICESFIEKNKRVFDLEKENAELKMGLKWDADNRDELLKENAGLKARLNAINLLTPELEKASKLRKQQLTKAKEIIKELLDTQSQLDPYRDIFKDRILKAEQFLEEVKDD